MKNPWTDLPQKPPFILPEDNKVLKTCKGSIVNTYHFEVMPDPFFGNPFNANVIILSLNPGFSDLDVFLQERDHYYTDQNRKSLTFESNNPFFILDDKLKHSGGYIWWGEKLKPLINVFGIDKVSRAVAVLQFIAYHSIDFRCLEKMLPSQDYTFDIVRNSISKNKIIILTRAERYWLSNVKELNGYSYITLRNQRNPTISEKNIGNKAFQKILKSFE